MSIHCPIETFLSKKGQNFQLLAVAIQIFTFFQPQYFELESYWLNWKIVGLKMGLLTLIELELNSSRTQKTCLINEGSPL